MTEVVQIISEVPSRRKSEVVTSYLDKDVKQVLEDWAEQEQRSVSSLIAYILTKAAREFQQQTGTQRDE
ncbi:MAG: ribbon-helix-helix domain-containing protein [Actinomycetota bacterium]